MTLDIFRPPSTLVASIEIDEKTVFSKKLMGDWYINCDFYSNSVIVFQIGDYITWQGENYYINRLPDLVKINAKTFQYKIVFQAVLYDLSRKLFISSDGLADYSYNGNAADFITNIVSSINEISSGWSVGSIDASDYITLQFANESCLAALTRIAEAFKMEYQVTGKVISLKKAAGSTRALTFRYGQGMGLYKLERQQVQNQNIITKCFGFGGTKNIALDYRNRAKRLVFESKYLLENDDIYGVIEGQFTNENIYPKRTGVLSSVSIDFDAGTSGTEYDSQTSYVVDSSIDFDIKDYLIEGQTATIVFKTGDMAGVECEIWKYIAATKRIYFNPYSDTDGYTIPKYNGGAPVQPQAGDTYTLVNISMPDAYVADAETALQAATQTFLDENCIPMVVYTLDFDPKQARTTGLVLDAGDKVTIIDSDLGVNTLIRVSGIEYPLVNPNQIKATIADFVPYSLQERIVKTVISAVKETTFVEKRSAELARRNTVRQNQLIGLLFDTDDYFDLQNIRPLSIETMYLSVGARSQNFRLNGVLIEPNYGGDANAIHISTGELIHFTIGIGTNYTWTLSPAATFSSLTPSTAYYLYAKCSQSAMTGTWDLSSAKKNADGGDGYYYFLCGVLYAVLDGARDYEFTYGMTYINGRIITTGRIRSIDGLNYFDLDSNQFMLGNGTTSFDWNVTTPGVLTLKGALVQSPGGATAPILVSRGPYDAGNVYYIGESVTYGGNTWNWINATPASGHTPAEDAYWTLASAGGVGLQGIPGADGIDGNDGINGTDGSLGPVGPGLVYRGVFNPVTIYYNNALRRDIVRYPTITDPAYLFKGTDNTYGAWSSGNWDSFGATFSSVATDILFAALAYIDNLGVKYFEGVPVTGGYFNGAIKIQGNDIWENTVNDDTTGTIRINFNGYNGGTTRNRSLIIGCGKGRSVIVINGENSDGRTPGLSLGEGVLGLATYATAGTRNAAIPYPYPGMMIFQQDEDQIMGYTSTGWHRITMH